MSAKSLPHKFFIATILLTSVSPAFAQGFKVNPKQLPDATRIEPAPLQIQILGPQVKVTDHRHAEEDDSYQLNIGAAPQAQHRVVQIGGPAGVGVGSGFGGGNTIIPISRNHLPRAGFESNMNSLPAAPAASLPNGRIHNALESVAAQRISHDAPKGSQIHSVGSQPSHQSAPMHQSTTPLTYAHDPVSISSSGFRKTETAVTGELKLGSLLKHAQ